VLLFLLPLPFFPFPFLPFLPFPFLPTPLLGGEAAASFFWTAPGGIIQMLRFQINNLLSNSKDRVVASVCFKH
jgi:hypothetical protein